MEIIPAIDLLEGKVVRLFQGRYDLVSAYDADPLERAKEYADAGATLLHVVDLDGARSGSAAHRDTIEAIAAWNGIRVQVGGGVRSEETVQQWWDAGVTRVVLGTAAIEDPAWTEDLCARHPDAVVLALDVREGRVATRGWAQDSGEDGVAAAQRFDAWGAAGFLTTVIERDGTSSGPDVSYTADLQRAVHTTVIASGGIRGMNDLEALRDAGVRAAICGRALYDPDFSLREALARMAASS